MMQLKDKKNSIQDTRLVRHITTRPRFSDFSLPNISLTEIIVIIAIVVVFIAIIIGFCHDAQNAQNKISTGIVVSKDWQPSYRDHDTYRPERFYLTIEGDKNGTIVQYEFQVPSLEYVKYEIGDEYPKHN